MLHTANMAGIIYCGDNIDVLPEYVPAESVDLVYLDPPFNSQRTYNLIYKGSNAQEVAFKDCWSWEEAAPTYARIVDSTVLPKGLRTLLRALHATLIEEDADQLAYLVMMAPRLAALHRALKATGSLYLHCDPTASHYLKIVLDSLFGPSGFLSEVIWKRTSAHSSANRFGPVHDTLLFYRKGKSYTWTDPRLAYEDAYLAKYYKYDDGDGRLYWRNSLTAAGVRAGTSGRPWRGYDPAAKGAHWKFSFDNLEALERDGKIYWPPKGGWPQIKRYRDELKGKAIADVWDDIDKINPAGSERIGYPTQKPLALLERIIGASSRPGDVVLDPFCGCGTTVEAAERLGRRWIGIDVATKAVEVIEARFERVGLDAPEVVWHPLDVQSALALAARDKRKFEEWALRKIKAVRLRKKDRGIDGEAFFRDGANKPWHVLVSVKGGSTNPAHVRELRGTIEREGAPIGVFLTAREPSKEMRHEATRAGFLPESDAEGPIPRIQFVTLARIFGELPAVRAPGTNVTPMPKASVPPPPGANEQLTLGLEAPPPVKAKPRSKGLVKAAPREEAPAPAIRTGTDRPPARRR